MEEIPKPADMPASAPPPKVARPFYLHPIAIVAALALAVLAWQWYDSRQQIGALQNELAQRLAAADVENKQSRGLAEQVREATREAQVKLGVLEAKLQESQNQQMQLAGNVKSALIALQAADARLARLDRPQLAGLRKVIARDVDRLKLAPYVDMIGISARIDNLAVLVDNLPLAMEVRAPDPADAAKGAAEPPASPWLRFTRELWRDMRELVRIERMERPDIPLLTPAQTYFLRENLKLRLLGARLALLAHDEKSFKTDLKAAREWLVRYYDGRNPAVVNAIAAVRQLNDSQISIEVP